MGRLLARPETPKFFEQFSRLTAGGGSGELWKEHLGTPDVRTKYIERRTFTIERGHVDEAIQLVQAEFERIHNSNAYLFTAVYGSFDALILDTGDNDAKAIEKWWDEWGATPEAAAFKEKRAPLVVTGKR